MYIQRNAGGDIVQLSREATADCREFIDPGAPELLAFIGDHEGAQRAALRRSDLEFVRVLEDVIELLMDKGVISFTELPEAAQQKVMERQTLRRRLSGLSLVGSEDEEGGVI